MCLWQQPDRMRMNGWPVLTVALWTPAVLMALRISHSDTSRQIHNAQCCSCLRLREVNTNIHTNVNLINFWLYLPNKYTSIQTHMHTHTSRSMHTNFSSSMYTSAWLWCCRIFSESERRMQELVVQGGERGEEWAIGLEEKEQHRDGEMVRKEGVDRWQGRRERDRGGAGWGAEIWGEQSL